MKELLVGLAFIFVLMFTAMMNTDLNMHQEQRVLLKATAEEAAASGAQYFVRNEYGDGYYNFTEEEGNKAVNYAIKTHLRLDDNLKPYEQSYWNQTPEIKVETTYIDYSNYSAFLVANEPNATPFPNKYKITHFGESFERLLFGPSVIVSINAGQPNYLLNFLNEHANEVIEHGIHTFEE